MAAKPSDQGGGEKVEHAHTGAGRQADLTARRVSSLGSANAALLRQLDVVSSLRGDPWTQADAMERFLSDWRAGRLARVALHRKLVDRAAELGLRLPPERARRLAEETERAQAVFDNEKRLAHRYTEMLNALREAGRSGLSQPQHDVEG